MTTKIFSEIETTEYDQLLAAACQCFGINPVEICGHGAFYGKGVDIELQRETLIKAYKAFCDYERKQKLEEFDRYEKFKT